VSECDLETLTIREPRPNRDDGPWERGTIVIHVSTHFLMRRSFLWGTEFLFSVGKQRDLTGMAQKIKWRV
jgi:hypothetical protein